MNLKCNASDPPLPRSIPRPLSAPASSELGTRSYRRNGALSELHPICTAQVLTYLKLMDLRLGFLINFNERLIKDGLNRIIL